MCIVGFSLVKCVVVVLEDWYLNVVIMWGELIIG